MSDWNDVKRVYDEARRCDPGQRAGFLREACGSDTNLRQEVESLLATECEDQFVEPPDATSIADLLEGCDADAAVGTAVGAYCLERRVGCGGMGVVYQAARADGEFEQKVAVKLIRSDVDSVSFARRLRTERQTLAYLNHPNIARLLDGGSTATGQPYLVMEYVDGTPINRYCDEHRLSTAQRLRLFRTVCRAVHHAHQQLVLHCDLKPGNILVTGEGVPKLLDFGIARVFRPDAAAQDPRTLTAQRLMTPEYASPEQIRGEPVTTASDVYALGVLLYEMLTGHRPYALCSSTLGALERAVLETDPPPPSSVIWRAPGTHASGDATDQSVTPESVSAVREGTPKRLARRLRGDLDNIVMMALRKEPDRRYASADQLAADIDAHLAQRPVSARPDALSYRLSKFVRRNRVGVVAAGVTAISLCAAAIGVGWQARVAARERDQAEAIATFLDEVLSSVEPERDGRDVTVLDVLGKAAARIEHELVEQPEVRAALRGTIGRAYLALGAYERSEPHLRAALAERRARLGDRHPDVIKSINDLCNLLYAVRKFEEAEGLLREALACCIARQGHDDLQTARTKNNLAAVLSEHGDLDEAERLFLEALDTRRALAGPVHLEAAETMNNLAGIAWRRKDLPRAQSLMRDALAIRRDLLDQEHPLVTQSIANLAMMLHVGERYDEAEPLYREALAVARKVLGEDHPHVGFVLGNFAALLEARDRHSEAEQLRRQCLEIYLRALPPSDPRVLINRLRLGQCVHAGGNLAEAEPLLVTAHEQLREQLGAEHAWTMEAADSLAQLYDASGRPETADIWRRRARKTAEAEQVDANQQAATAPAKP